MTDTNTHHHDLRRFLPLVRCSDRPLTAYLSTNRTTWRATDGHRMHEAGGCYDFGPDVRGLDREIVEIVKDAAWRWDGARFESMHGTLIPRPRTAQPSWCGDWWPCLSSNPRRLTLADATDGTDCAGESARVFHRTLVSPQYLDDAIRFLLHGLRGKARTEARDVIAVHVWGALDPVVLFTDTARALIMPRLPK